MPQEKFDRFPQGGFAEFSHRLRVFFNCHMQRILGRENLACSYEAFQFRSCESVNCDRIFRQSTQDCPGDSLCFRFVGKVLLYASTSGIIGKLIHCLTAIDGMIKFDCLLTV